jgi:biopolymer transport protein ExbB
MKFFKVTTRVSQGTYVLLCLAMLFFIFTLPGGFAQEASPTSAASVTEAPTPTKALPKMTLWQVIVLGGVWMVPLAIASFAAVGLIVNNFMMLQRKKLTRNELLPSLLQQLANRDIDGALQACAANPCLFTNILEGGLARITTDDIVTANIQKGIDETGQAQVSNLIKPVNYLTNIASVSPMLGLLGTVSGMIKAFQGLSVDGGADPGAMAANISEALITTAAGLIIAIPAMLFYFYFKNNFMETISVINAEIGRLVNALETGAVMYVPSDKIDDEEAGAEA